MPWYNAKCSSPICFFSYRLEEDDELSAKQKAQKKHDAGHKACYESAPFNEVDVSEDDPPND